MKKNDYVELKKLIEMIKGHKKIKVKSNSK